MPAIADLFARVRRRVCVGCSPRISQHGYTLIELLLVVALVGVLAAIVASHVRGVRDMAASAACSGEVQSVQTALDSYAIQHSGWQKAFAPGPMTQSELRALVAGGYLHTVPSTCPRGMRLVAVADGGLTALPA